MLIIYPKGSILQNNIFTIMSEQLTASLFDESTEMYRQGNYPVCLALLNDCILLEPAHSTLYSNRAISNFGLKWPSDALSDLQRSIEINHLNYIAYFNLFSINLHQEKPAAGFHNLCLCLSSAYTVLSRRGMNADWIDQSLHYAYNNKQSIFLKAMHSLQFGQHSQALTLLREALALENQACNKENLQGLVNQLETLMEMPITFFPSLAQPLAPSFTLKTDLPCPVGEDFTPKVDKMLKEFNELNRLINEVEDERIKEMSTTEKSIQSSEKMEKETNCRTVYESTLDQPASALRDERAEEEDNSSIERQDRLDKLHLYSTISEGNEEQKEIQSKVNSYNLYPLTQNSQCVNIYFEQATFVLQEELEENSLLYAVFNCSTERNQAILRTANAELKEGLCRWSEWSTNIPLANSPSTISFTIFNKTFTSFQDRVVGEGAFQLSETGYMSIPFSNSSNDYLGELEMSVLRV